MSDHPEIRTPELAVIICGRLADGETLRAICRDEGMPSEAAVRRWSLEDAEFGAQYTRARELGYLQMADEINEIADDGSNDWMERETRTGRIITVPDQENIARSKLRVDTRKWLLSKMLPKVYGERTAVELSGKDGGPLVVDDHTRMARIEAIFEAAARIRAGDGSDLV